MEDIEPEQFERFGGVEKGAREQMIKARERMLEARERALGGGYLYANEITEVE